MRTILSALFSNWARFIVALAAAYFFSRGLGSEMIFLACLIAFSAFGAGFMYGWVIQQLFLGVRARMRIISLTASLFLVYSLTKMGTIAWFSPDEPYEGRLVNICVFIPLTHSALAVAYYVITRRTLPPPIHRNPGLEEGQKRLE